MQDKLVLAGTELSSRLIIGTGKYSSLDQTRAAIEASGAAMVTVAIRRVNLDKPEESLLSAIDLKQTMLLPNTAGCYTAEDAVTTARLAREVGLGEFVKLEVLGDKKTLYPDNEQLLTAVSQLVKEGFKVLPYCSDDPITAVKLADLGCPAVMPLAAPIGSGLGVLNPYNLLMILEAVSVPVIVDAGVGTASDAARVMELGVDGVLMNTAIACAKEPVRMARAMGLAVEAGREAFLAGRIPKRRHAQASSPETGLIE